jgi:methionyl-tRNA synthetase
MTGLFDRPFNPAREAALVTGAGNGTGRAIAQALVGDGVRTVFADIDACITRDLACGVPVPRAGFEGKVFHVWFDAPIAYIAATQDWATASGGDWRKWWWGEAARETQYVRFLRKDNAPFHTVSLFPRHPARFRRAMAHG